MNIFKNIEKVYDLINDIESGKIIDLNAPKASLKKLDERCENELEIDEEIFKQLLEKLDFNQFFSKSNIKKVLIESFQNQKEKLNVNQELLKFLTNIDEKKVIDSINKLGISNNNIEEKIETVALIDELDNITGEMLVRRLTTNIPSIIEYCKKYIQFLALCANENIKNSTTNLSRLIEQINKLEINYPLLLEPLKDILLIRNSCSHKNFKFDLEKNELIMWDKNTKEISLKPKDLHMKILKLFEFVSNIEDTIIYFKLEKTISKIS